MSPLSRAERDAPAAPPDGSAGSLIGSLVGAAWIGAGFGLFDGLVRTLGIDPGLFLIRLEHQGLRTALTYGLPHAGDLPGLLGCTLGAAALYAAGTAMVAAVLFALASLVPLLRAHRRFVVSTVVGAAWLFAELFWWSRPKVLPGLAASDPRRLAVAGGMGLACLALAALVARRARRPARRSAHPAARVALAAIVLLGGGYLALDRMGSAAGRGRVSEANERLPNVLLFVVDALRQDVLSCYGHPVVKTPAIDRLAAEGVRFAHARAQAPFTWPSFGSILTGKYPGRHGLVTMEAGYKLPENVTLPLYLHGAPLKDGGQLHADDFLGGAFLTGTLSHGSGLAQGFDYLLEAMVGHELFDVHSRWSKFRSGLLPWLYRNKVHQHLDSALVAREAVAWFRANADRRFVALVHYYSTHTPYDPPARFRAMYCDPEYDGPFQAFYAEQRQAIERGEIVPTERDVAAIRNLYYAGVSQADAMIGEVVDELERQGILDDTIVAVTADHGESLGEHGLWEHGHMYQDNLAVPLVLRWPARLPRGKVVDALVESVDLMPTLLDLMDLAPLPAVRDLPPEADRTTQLDALDGASLVPLIEGKATEAKPYSFSENRFGRLRSFAVQDARWKLVVHESGDLGEGWRAVAQRAEEPARRPWLFDLASDPAEEHNLFGAGDATREVTERLWTALQEWHAALPQRRLVRSSEGDIEAQSRLMDALGYGGGREQDDPEDAPK